MRTVSAAVARRRRRRGETNRGGRGRLCGGADASETSDNARAARAQCGSRSRLRRAAPRRAASLPSLPSLRVSPPPLHALSRLSSRHRLLVVVLRFAPSSVAPFLSVACTVCRLGRRFWGGGGVPFVLVVSRVCTRCVHSRIAWFRSSPRISTQIVDEKRERSAHSDPKAEEKGEGPHDDAPMSQPSRRLVARRRPPVLSPSSARHRRGTPRGASFTRASSILRAPLLLCRPRCW